MDLETLVRPFEAPTPIGTKRITPVRTQVPDETAGGRWGVAGNLPVAVEVPPGEDPLTVSFNVKKTKDYDLDRNQSARQVVKVSNPEDPDQYVMVERLKSAKFKDKKPDNYAVFAPNGDLLYNVQDANSGMPIQYVQPPKGYPAYGFDASGNPRDTLTAKEIGDANYNINFPPGANEAIVREIGPSG